MVDDSAVVREVLKQMLNSDAGIEVVGTAGNGQEAVSQAHRLKPDLITMDLKMPVMDGMEATKKIMAYHPTPILIVTSYIDRHGMYTTLDALSAGALDVMEKPTVLPDSQWDPLARTLIDKVKTLSQVRVITHVQGKLRDTWRQRSLRAAAEQNLEIAGIGVSTGGPSVLRELFQGLPAGFPLPVLVIQHIAEGFTQGLVEWLQQVCRVPIKVAEEGEPVRSGTIYFAREEAHLEVLPDRRLHYSHGEPKNGHRPSADVTLNSLARVYKNRSLGVLLTGMGCDGAEGLKAIRDAGGMTWVQNEESCIVFGMPRAAIEQGAARRVLSVSEMLDSLLHLHRIHSRSSVH